MGATREKVRLAVYLFLVTSAFGFLQPFLPLYLEASGLNRFQIGLVVGLGTAMAFVIQPVLGRLSDRIDARRPFIFFSALFAGLAYLSFPIAQGFGFFLVLVAVGANAVLYLNAAGGVLVGRMVAASQGGALYAALRVWGSVGYIVTSLLSGWLVGPRPALRPALDDVFRWGPSVFFAIAALAWFLPDRKSETPAADANQKEPIPANLRRFLKGYFLYSLALYGASGFLSLYMKELGATGPWITGMFAAGVVVEVMVMRWAGRFSDRYGRRPALAVSFLLLPIRLLLYIPATGPMWVLAVQMLHGVNFGIVGAVAIAFANDLASDRTRGRAQAQLAAATGLASAIGPVILGASAEAGGLGAMFFVAAMLAAAGAAIFVGGVEDSHPDSRSLADRAPEKLRPALRWLDAPIRRRSTD